MEPGPWTQRFGTSQRDVSLSQATLYLSLGVQFVTTLAELARTLEMGKGEGEGGAASLKNWKVSFGVQERPEIN